LQPTEIGRSVGSPGAGSWDIFEIRPGANFTNKFTREDSKSAKDSQVISTFLQFLGSVHEKASCKTLVKLTPGVYFANIL